MSEHDFPAGAIIFRPGDLGARAYLIREGTVEVAGARLGTGDVFGEMTLIEERPHAQTARAVSAVKMSAVTRDEFEALLTGDPATFRLYLKALLERLRALAALESGAAEPAATGVAVTIHPLTRRAAETLPGDGLPVTKFPLRIGRAAEALEGQVFDLNDLWLLDRVPFNISRNHALIDLEGSAVVFKDRGSSRGCYVNDELIGGSARARQAALEDGDNVVVLGTRSSPYQFRIHVTRA